MQISTDQNNNMTHAAKILLSLMIIVELYVSLKPFDGIATITNFDKLMHFGMYAANAVVAALAFPVARSYVLALLLLFLLGPLIEFLQHFSPGREASVFDQLANTAGLFAGALFSRLLLLRKKIV
ncbi:MAG: VanZ family protein [Pseudomonadales bacterium]